MKFATPGFRSLSFALVLGASGCGSSGQSPADAGSSDAGTDTVIPLDGSGSDVAVGDGGADAMSCAPVPYDASAPADGGTVGGLHGLRYCEVLLVTLSNGNASVDVYNTLGLSDCPADAWAALDPSALRAEAMVSSVALNGPRYWVLDAFENSRLLDGTVREFGCIPMRLSGHIDAPASDLLAGRMPYTPLTVMRDTQELFLAGTMVYELVAPDGKIYDMQSYSVQTTAQTEESLSTLGARLTLPTGWTFRARVLTADLHVMAVGGLATVVQDDFANTYQLSQQ